jgi:asparagine synthase (glutamine-hydrolysing)
MCGIAGVLSDGHDTSVRDRLDHMVRVQVHRGPDGNGVWSGSIGATRVGLGSTRLAILDLSDAGSQPLVSTSGDHVLVYNGEIYNYLELRQELQALGHVFSSQCDTEVLLHTLMQWGEAGLQRLNGMWGLAWLDRRAGRLLLARDRVGIKPLYYYRDGARLYFASEIKAILAACGQRFDVNTTAVLRFLQQSLRDAQPETFFKGIYALPAGCVARVDLRAGVTAFDVQRYWSAPPLGTASLSPQQAVEALRELLLDSVRLRLRSDVPVGVLLSGGVDSSAIAAAMHHALGQGADLHLISAVTDDSTRDEQPFIDRMAAHLRHKPRKVHIRPEPRELLQLLHTVTYYNDEPVGSFSYVAQYLLMQHAQELGIVVILNGQGADELLCGYLKYLGFYVQSLLMAGQPHTAASVLLQFARRRTVLPQVRLGDAKRYAPWLLPKVRAELRGPRLRHSTDNANIGLGSGGVLGRQIDDLYRFSIPPILHTEDRISMAVSREVRVPFLDYRLVELLLPMPVELKLRDGWTKWVLRKAMEPFLPPEIAWRRDKRHFTLPEEDWLQHELRPTIERLFGEDLMIARAGLVDAQRLRRLYAAYCSQRSARRSISFKDVFNPLALEVWMREFHAHLSERTDA